MITIDPIAQALHDKSCRGGVLTPEEQERLRQWYAKNDEEETAMLERAQRDRLNRLQEKIDDTTAKIVEEAHKIQALEFENERLRGEIARLESQLAQKMNRQPV